MQYEKEFLRELYRNLLDMRLLEKKMVDTYAQGRVPGHVHSGVGQEATYVGVLTNFKEGDYYKRTHRVTAVPYMMGTSLDTFFGELLAKKTELNVQRERANKLVQQLRASKAEVQEDMDDLSAEEAAVQAQIVKLSKQLAEEQAAKGQASNTALGGYIWPVNSRRITSTFGGRASPGGIGSTNHKGLDIGGVGYNSQVFAAKAGTVIVSQYSRGYGNYVVVSHGSGNTTLYAHMSSRKVSVGQYVNQGDTLGITGSTGNSTGPHLHFEITENGVRIDPLKYLTNYIKNWS